MWYSIIYTQGTPIFRAFLIEIAFLQHAHSNRVGKDTVLGLSKDY